MSNILGFTTARRTSRGELLAGWLGGGRAEVYTAPRPGSDNDEATTQTLLITFTFPGPAGTVTDGVFTGDEIAQAMADANGIASWTRLFDSANAPIGNADVGLTGSGAFLQLDNLSLVEGGYVSVTAFGITER